MSCCALCVYKEGLKDWHDLGLGNHHSASVTNSADLPRLSVHVFAIHTTEMYFAIYLAAAVTLTQHSVKKISDWQDRKIQESRAFSHSISLFFFSFIYCTALITCTIAATSTTFTKCIFHKNRKNLNMMSITACLYFFFNFFYWEPHQVLFHSIPHTVMVHTHVFKYM